MSARLVEIPEENLELELRPAWMLGARELEELLAEHELGRLSALVVGPYSSNGARLSSAARAARASAGEHPSGTLYGAAEVLEELAELVKVAAAHRSAREDAAMRLAGYRERLGQTLETFESELRSDLARRDELMAEERAELERRLGRISAMLGFALEPVREGAAPDLERAAELAEELGNVTRDLHELGAPQKDGIAEHLETHIGFVREELETLEKLEAELEETEGIG